LTPSSSSASQFAIIYGNTSVSKISATSCTAYVKILGDAQPTRVTFNINPSYSKPTATFQCEKKYAEYTYAMKQQFPCHMTLHFKDRPPITIQHYMKHEDKWEGRVSVFKINQCSKPKKGTTFDPRQGQYGRVIGNGEVEYVDGFNRRPATPNERGEAEEEQEEVDLDGVMALLLADSYAYLGSNSSARSYIDAIADAIKNTKRGNALIQQVKISRQQNELHRKNLASTPPPSKFYQVSIDCPGYGNSAGDRQTVRSYPTELVQSIINSLGFKTAYCVIGSSQGSCSLFNALTEKPDLSRHLVCMHPISTGSMLERYSRITCPSLLVYNVADRGHPVSVGRKVKKVFQKANKALHYVEFDSEKFPDFEDDFMGSLMLSMFAKAGVREEKHTKRQLGPNLALVVGGLNGFREGVF
jgi:hypothetical protein